MEVKCTHHLDVPATAVCDQCHRPFCDMCYTRLGNQVLCKTCLERRFSQRSRYNSGGLFLLSLFPGAGHLYLGLRTRGLQLMAAVFGTAFLAGMLGFEPIIPLAWIVGIFFSIFDAREAAHRIDQGLEVPDQPLFEADWLKNPRLIGYGLILLGSYAFLRSMVREVAPYVLGIPAYALNRLMDTTVLAAALIGVGFWMLQRKAGDR